MSKALALILCAAAVLGLIAWQAYEIREQRRRADGAEQMTASLRSQIDSGQDATTTVIRYIDRTHTIRATRDTLAKEIPLYVTPEADAACIVPAGFVRVHDAAAVGTLLNPGAGDADATPSVLTLSAVSGTVAGNYTASLENAEQLTELQALLRRQGATIIGAEP